MNQLMSVRTNIFYTKDEEGNFHRHNELVLLLDNATYKYDETGEKIIRERKLDEVRFTVDNEGMTAFIKALAIYADVEEKDLGA